MNSVQMIGNMVADPELRFTKDQKPVCGFRIAVGRGDDTLFISVTTWGKTAENVCEYQKKGCKVGVEGTLIEDTWETQDGQKRSKMKINAYRVHFLTPKQSGNGGDGGQQEAF